METYFKSCDCVRFCGVNKLAFRGSNNEIGKPGVEYFIILINSYDSVLSSHLKYRGQTTCLSTEIRN